MPNPTTSSNQITKCPLSRGVAALKWQVPADALPHQITIPMSHVSGQETFSIVKESDNTIVVGASIDNVSFDNGGVQMEVTLPNAYVDDTRILLHSVGGVSQIDLPTAFRDQIDVLMQVGALSVISGSADLNWWIGVTPITFTIQVANYNAIAFDWVDMTTGAGDKAVTFPASPATNDIIKVAKADAGAGVVNIAGNGKNINGSAADVINNQYTVVSYQYNGTEWRKF